jgi:hypothetical protein
MKKILSVCVLLLIGCSSPEKPKEMTFKEIKQAVDACIAFGGVPTQVNDKNMVIDNDNPYVEYRITHKVICGYDEKSYDISNLRLEVIDLKLKLLKGE